jgi:hypothetical protein
VCPYKKFRNSTIHRIPCDSCFIQSSAMRIRCLTLSKILLPATTDSHHSTGVFTRFVSWSFFCISPTELPKTKHKSLLALKRVVILLSF